MIAKLISEYIKSNSRLVLPEFGAFIKKEDSGMVAFVPFLKRDDGVLKGLVADSLSVSMDDATAMLDEFTFSIKQGVAQNGQFIIEGLGAIAKDANGIYTMSYNPNISAETIAVEEIVAQQPQMVQEIVEQVPVAEKPAMNIGVGNLDIKPAPEKVVVETPREPQLFEQDSNIVDLHVEPEPVKPVVVRPVATPRPTPVAQPQPVQTPRAVQPQQPVQPTPRAVAQPQPVQPKASSMDHASQVDRLYNDDANTMAEEPRSAQPQGPRSGSKPVASRAKRKGAPRKKQKHTKLDIIMIVAIVAIVAGIIVLLYGILFPATAPSLFIG